jgi:hypothetical protein
MISWRLICSECTQMLSEIAEEIKSVGILQHADIACVNCGVRIRRDRFDKDGDWYPVSEEQLARLRVHVTEKKDARLHYGFSLDEGEEKLGLAQDEICQNRVVRCKVFKCEPENTGGSHVVRIYLNDHTPHPIFAGTVWRYDRFPSDDDIALALRRWRGPEAPKFAIEWYEETESKS